MYIFNPLNSFRVTCMYMYLELTTCNWITNQGFYLWESWFSFSQLPWIACNSLFTGELLGCHPFISVYQLARLLCRSCCLWNHIVDIWFMHYSHTIANKDTTPKVQYPWLVQMQKFWTKCLKTEARYIEERSSTMIKLALCKR